MCRVLVIHALLAVSAVLALDGCSATNTEYMADVDPTMWRTDQPGVIKYWNADTTGIFKMELILVSRGDFDGRPLGFNISVTAPDSTNIQEIVEESFFKYTQNGKSYAHFTRPYRDSVRFAQTGIYVISIAPSRNVAGIKAVGINTIYTADGKE